MTPRRSRPPLLAALAAVAAVVGCPAALAQEPPEPIVVAGPPLPADPAPAEEELLDGPAPDRLFADAGARVLCIGADGYVLEPTEDNVGRSGSDGACQEVPREDLFEPFHLLLRGQPEDGRIGGAVREDVAAVELDVAGSPAVRFATAPAPAALAGTAGADMRFYLGRRPAGHLVTVRLLDAAGAVLHEEDEPDWDGPGRHGRLVRGPVRAAAGGGDGWAWSVKAEIRNQLDPVRGAPTRRERRVCLTLQRSGDGASGMDQGPCAPAHLEEPVVQTEGGCEDARGRHVVLGLAPAGRLPRWMVTTDGRRLALRSSALPARLAVPELRMIAATAPPGVGVRRLEGGGAPVPVYAPPPTLVSCSMTLFGYDEPVVAQPPLGGDIVLRPGGPAGPRLFVRDAGERLCVAAERAVRDRDCQLPSPELYSVHAAVAAGGRHVVGAVDPRVRRVRARLSSGAAVEVPTSAGEGYTGRYAGRVSFFALTAPAGTRVLAITPMTARGTSLPRWQVSEPRLAAPARRKGAVRIAGQRVAVAVGRLENGDRCTFLAGGPLPGAGDPCPDEGELPGGLYLDVACGGPVMTVLGVVRGRGQEVEAVLRGGRVVRGPVLRTAADEAVVAVTVPSRAALRRIDIRSRDGALLRRYAVPAPPAAEQCGYRTYLFEKRTGVLPG